MAHMQQLEFVRKVVHELISRHKKIDSVLEIGSYDVNGSVRGFFNATKYVGVDLTAGPGVDIVYDGRNLNLSEKFDLCISCECFEHDPNWQNSFKNMIEHTEDGGVVIFTCASKGRVEHGTSRTESNQSPGTTSIGIDHYRNLTARDFLSAFDFDQMFDSHSFHYHKASCDLYFLGVLKGETAGVDIDSESLVREAVKSIKNEERLAKETHPHPILLSIYHALTSVDLPLRKVLAWQSSEVLYQDYCVVRGKLIAAAISRVRVFIKK